MCPSGSLAGLSVSRDRGVTWASVNLPSVLADPPSGGIAAVDASDAYVYGAGTGRLLRVSVGKSPVDVTDGPTGPLTYLLGFTTPQIGFALTATQNTTQYQLWRTVDGGLTWKVVTV